MEFLHAAVAMLASMVLILAGMVGWLYWQQTRMFQNMNSIVMVIGELARPHQATLEPAEVELTTTEESPEPKKEEEVEEEKQEEEEEDDRVSVVQGPPEAVDIDGLESKTTKELKDMLTKRGIPFGKRDSKNVLISLLKATA
jgi:hypothetical protein